MRKRPEPTTTAFAILGMLASRPMTSYELAKGFDRSVRRLWPRARSKLFEAPKHLVALGYARAARERTGARWKTVYAITPSGRRALAAWLSRPGDGPALEFEQLLKIFFAEHGSKKAVVANLEGAAAWAAAQMEEQLAAGRRSLEGADAFQARAGQVTIAGTFLTEFALMVDRWARWALGVVKRWPENAAAAKPDRPALVSITRRLERRLRELRNEEKAV